MVWFKVDDKFHDSKKARLAGPDALGLWVLAGSFAAGDDGTDGFIADAVCVRWAKNYRALARKLVAAGLWAPGEHEGESGWWFHDWLDYQISAEETRTKKEKARVRMAAARKAKAERLREHDANSASTSSERADDVRSTPSRPEPDPNQRTLNSVGGVGHETLPATSEPSPPRCTEHARLPADAPVPACRGCQQARLNAEREATARSAAAVAAAEQCPYCHGSHWIVDPDHPEKPPVKCTHSARPEERTA